MEQGKTNPPNGLRALIDELYARARGSGGSASATQFAFVYAPNGVAGGNVYTSFPALHAAMNAVPGIKLVLLDDGGVPGSCIVPAGAWNMKGWLIEGAVNIAGTSTLLVFQQGATLTAVWTDATYVGFETESNAPVYTMANGDTVVLDTGSGVFAAPGAAPFFVTPNGVQAGIGMLTGTELGGSNLPVWQLDAGSSPFLILGGFHSELNDNALSGSANLLVQYAVTAKYSTNQPAWTGVGNFQTLPILYSNLSPPPPTGLQSGRQFQWRGYVTTVNAGAVTIDTGYAPPQQHVARVTLSYSIADRTADLGHYSNLYCGIQSFGAPTIPAGQVQVGTTSDGALATALPTAVITGASLLGFTCTPPGGHVGTLDWMLVITIEEN